MPQIAGGGKEAAAASKDAGAGAERGEAGSACRCDAAQARRQVGGAEVGDADQAARRTRARRDEVPTLEPGPSVAMLEPLAPGRGRLQHRRDPRDLARLLRHHLDRARQRASSTRSRSAGRPDGYVLGTEGGGAFLAGLRYGSGTLYMRAGGSSKIYWHGPSIGTDIGAVGLAHHVPDLPAAASPRISTASSPASTARPISSAASASRSSRAAT